MACREVCTEDGPTARAEAVARDLESEQLWLHALSDDLHRVISQEAEAQINFLYAVIPFEGLWWGGHISMSTLMLDSELGLGAASAKYSTSAFLLFPYTNFHACGPRTRIRLSRAGQWMEA